MNGRDQQDQLPSRRATILIFIAVSLPMIAALWLSLARILGA